MIAEETFGRDFVPVFTAALLNHIKAGTNLNAFDGINTHQGFGDIRIQPVGLVKANISA